MDMVDLAEIDSSIVIDIRWAGPDNMLGRKVYPDNKCYLRRDTAEKLAQAQRVLKEQGKGLKVWEGYRPLWMQQKLWDEIADGDLVSNPQYGRRTHIRGIAVDVTLVDDHGVEMEMPTKYCEFSKREEMKHAYTNLPLEIRRNRRMLKDAMVAAGFKPYKNEWWHYNLPNWKDFPILKEDKWVGSPVD